MSKPIFKPALLAAAAVLLLPWSAEATGRLQPGDYRLEIGEDHGRNHEDWIELLMVDHEMSSRNRLELEFELKDPSSKLGRKLLEIAEGSRRIPRLKLRGRSGRREVVLRNVRIRRHPGTEALNPYFRAKGETQGGIKGSRPSREAPPGRSAVGDSSSSHRSTKRGVPIEARLEIPREGRRLLALIIKIPDPSTIRQGRVRAVLGARGGEPPETRVLGRVEGCPSSPGATDGRGRHPSRWDGVHAVQDRASNSILLSEQQGSACRIIIPLPPIYVAGIEGNDVGSSG